MHLVPRCRANLFRNRLTLFPEADVSVTSFFDLSRPVGILNSAKDDLETLNVPTPLASLRISDRPASLLNHSIRLGLSTFAKGVST